MNKPNKSLFRKECIEHNKPTLIGQIMLTSPFSVNLIIIFFILIFIAIIYLFVFFEYGRKINGKGALLPKEGVITILPSENSIVDQVLVKENQEVKMGEPLFILRNLKYSTTYDAVKKYLLSRKNSLTIEHNLQLEQNRVKIISAQQTKKNLEEEKKILEAQIVVQTEKVQITDDTLEKYNRLYSVNAVSEIEFNNRRSESLDQKSLLFDLEQKLASVNRYINDLETELLQIPLEEQKEISIFENEIEAIEKELVENNAFKFTTVFAPKDGIIGNILVSKGQSVYENMLMATVLPNNPTLEANLFIPSSAIGFIEEGLSVSLRYDAFPYQKFGQQSGIVIDVANNAIHSSELKSLGIYSQLFSNEKDTYYRIKVKLNNQDILAYGKHYPLKIGMSLESNIILDKRKIYEWIFEPLIGIQGI